MPRITALLLTFAILCFPGARLTAAQEILDSIRL
jgi:hypothetical protein